MLRLLLFLVAAVFLNGCATPRARTASPQASPVTAPQKPHVVNGKRYQPLSHADGFVQEGFASSYGRDFHGRTTSNGETFDMTALTAAHKTLPFGVYVQVEHKRSGKKVEVRINDRGPFVQDRIIDLSEMAARQLGILQEGVAPVVVTALGYKSNAAAGGFRQPDSYDRGHFTLQVGAFTVRQNAYRYRDELKKKYGAADVQESWINAVKYYRVRLGSYTSLAKAQASKEEYQRRAFPGCFVVAIE